MSSLARFSGSPVSCRPRTPALLIAWAKGVQLDSPSGLYSVRAVRLADVHADAHSADHEYVPATRVQAALIVPGHRGVALVDDELSSVVAACVVAPRREHVDRVEQVLVQAGTAHDIRA